MDVGIIGQTILKTLVHLYVDLFIFVLLNSYYLSSMDVGIIGQTMLKTLVHLYVDLFNSKNHRDFILNN